jgi:5'-3' exonuclease
MDIKEPCIIASVDKDLLQVPGKHYNFVKNELYDISPQEGLKKFWTQMLVGDVADNIFGIKGIGPKKAEKIFEYIYEEDLELLNRAYYNCVASLYNDSVRMHRNAKLLWVLRQPDGVWLSPDERIKQDEV